MTQTARQDTVIFNKVTAKVHIDSYSKWSESG